MPNILFLKTTPKRIFPYKYCLIILKKMITVFGTLITGKPVDHEKNKKFTCQKFIWLQVAENLLLISGMVFEKND
jgi:hypothetical protein